MTKKGKRTAMIQRTEEIAQLQRENEHLRARLAECQKAEKVPPQSQELLRALIDTSTDAFTVYDSRLNLIDLNGAALKYLGPEVPRDEVIGKNLAEFIQNKDVLDRLTRVMETGEALTIEQTLALPAAGEFTFITRAFKVGDGLGIVTTDITARKRMENDLRKSQELLRSFMDSATDAFTIYDSRLNIVDVNQTVLQYLGTGARREDVIGKNLADFIPDRERHVPYLKVMETGEPLTSEETFVLPTVGEFSVVTRTFRVGDGIGIVTSDVSAQRRIEKDLRASEEKYRLLVENTNEAIAVLQDGVIKFANPKLTALSGYTNEDLISKSFLELVHPDDQQKTIENHMRRMAGDRTPNIYQFRAIDKAGITRWVEINAVFLDWEGKPATLALLNDVTARVAAQQALEESEKKYRMLVEGSADMVFSLDAQGNFTYISPAAERVSGFKPEEIIGQSYVDRILPEDLPGLMASFERTLGGANEPSEFRSVHKDGTVGWVRTSSRVTYREGKPVGVTGIMSDITERKRAEEQLQRQERYFRAITEHSSEVVVVLDKGGNHRYISPNIENMLGVPREKALQDSFVTSVHLDDMAMIASDMAYYLEHPEGTVQREVRIQHADGSWRYVEATGCSLLHDPAVEGVVVNMRDVTERKKAEMALAESEARYKNLFEHTLVGMEVIDGTTGRVVIANHSIAQMFGFKSPEDMIGTNPMEYVLPEDLEWVTNQYARMLADPEVHEMATLRAKTEDGRIIWVLGSTTSFEYEGKLAALISLVDMTAAKEAEMKLHESEEKYRLLTEMTNDLIYTSTLEMEDTYVSPSVERILGCTPEEYLARDAAQKVTSESLARAQEALQEHLTLERGAEPGDGGRVARIELVHYRKDGTRVWLEHQVSSIREASGNIIGLHGVARDITERKQAEELLAASEEKYRALAEGSIQGIVIAQGVPPRFVYCNKALADMAGYTVDEFLSMGTEQVVGIIHPDDRADFFKRFIDRLDGLPSEGRHEFRAMRKDGSVLWLESFSSVIEYEGQPAVQAAFVDISGRKQAEEVLRNRTEELDNFFNVTVDLLCIADTDGRFRRLNMAWERTLGRAVDVLAASRFYEYIHPDDVERTQEAVARLASGQEVVNFINRYRCHDGSYCWLEWRATPSGNLIYAAARDVTERRKAEELLRASEEKYRGIFNENIVTIYTFDEKKHFTETNQAGCDLLGYSRDELLQMSIPDVDADPVVVLPAHAELLSGGRLINYEHRLRRKDGNVITVLNNSRPLTDAKGSVVGMQSTLLDITERVAAQQAMRESEERYRLLAENATDVIFTADAGLGLTYASPSVTNALGYNAEEIIGMSFEKLVAPASLEAVIEVHAADMAREAQAPGAMAEGAVDVEMVRKDGATVWMEAAVKPIRDAEGRIASYQGACRDITARRRAENSLRESEERFRQITENMLDAVTLVDGTGIVRYVSPSHERILGYKPEDLVGRPVFDNIHPEDMDKVMASLEGLIETGEARFQYRFRHADGHYLWGEASVKVLHDDSGNVSGSVIASRDVSDRVEAEEATKASEKKFRTLFDSISDAIFIHDMEGPILEVNRAGCEKLGYTREDLLTMTPIDVDTPEQASGVPERVNRVVEQGQVIFESAHRARDGRVIPVEVNARTMEFGGRQAVLSVARDITERKRAEEALRGSEERYRLVFENSPVSIWEEDFSGVKAFLDRLKKHGVTDLEAYFGEHPESVQQCAEMARIVDVNQATLALHGASSKEELLAGLVNTFTAESFDTFRQELVCLWNGGTAMTRDAVVRTLAGDLRYVTVSFAVAPGFQESLSRVLVSLADITDRKQAETKLKESEKRLNEAQALGHMGDWEYDFASQRVIWSDEMYLLYDRDPALGPPTWDEQIGYYLPQQQPMIYDSAFNAIEKGQESAYDLEAKLPSGRTVHFQATMRSTKDSDGKVIRLSGTLLDITERKLAEQALRASEERHRLLTERANDIVYTSDISLRGTYISPSVERILGFTPEERLRQNVSQQMTPESFARAVEVLAQQLELEKDPNSDPNRIIRIDLEYYRKDGSTVWLEDQISGIRDEHGTLIGVYGVARDITERLKAEEALRESEARFRRLSEAAEEGIAIHDMGTIVEANEALARMFGYPLPELIGMNAERMATPESWQVIVQQMASGSTEPYEGQGVRKDGSTFWCSLVGKPYQYKGRGLRLAAFRDITERKRAEESLEREEQRFRAIAENSSDVIVMVDRNGKLIYESPAIESVLGFSAKERVGLSVFSRIHPDDLHLVTGPFQLLLGNPQAPVQRAEIRLQHKDGSWRIVEAAASAVVRGGATEALVINLHDITERKRAEEALRERLKELRCIAAISRLAEKAEMPVEDFVREAVVLLPAAWRFPESCGARIRFDTREFSTENFRETQWGQSSDIRVDEKRFGTITVCYLEEMPEADEGPFFREERDLIDTIADFMGHVIQHRQMEGSLRASEERYRLLAENATDVIWTMDMNLKYTYVSPSVTRVTGYSPEESVAMSLQETLTPASFEVVSRIAERQMVAEGTREMRQMTTFEAELNCKDGGAVWVEIRAAFLHDSDGKAVGILGVSRDIAERKRAEREIEQAHMELEARVEQRTAELTEANDLLVQQIHQRQEAQEKLQESESRYRELVEGANSVILELDTKGKIAFFNRYAQQFFGFAEEEIIGRHAVGTIAPAVDSQGKDLKALTRELVKHPENYLVIENEGVRRNGERVWISWTNKGLYDTKGRLRNILCIGMDRTEQKRVAELLEQQLKEKAASEERQRLARDLHDAVTQTLFSASLIAEVLPQLWHKDRSEGERRLEELRRLTRGALAEMRMLLLELRPAALGEVGLVNLLRQLVEAIRVQANIRVSLTLHGECDVPSDVQVALYRVAQEALNNVVKHSGAAEVAVKLTCRKGSASLGISDNGSGFDLAKVSPRSLGLRIMQERAEAVGAVLKIDGRVGQGTNVRARWSNAMGKGDS